MLQGFNQGDIGVFEIHVLADHGHVDLGSGVLLRLDHDIPLAEIRFGQIQPKLARHNAIQSLLVHHRRNLVEIVGIVSRDD